MSSKCFYYSLPACIKKQEAVFESDAIISTALKPSLHKGRAACGFEFVRPRRCGAVSTWGLTSVNHETRCSESWLHCVSDSVKCRVMSGACVFFVWRPLKCRTQEEPAYCLFTTPRSFSVIYIQAWVPQQQHFFFLIYSVTPGPALRGPNILVLSSRYPDV